MRTPILAVMFLGLMIGGASAAKKKGGGNPEPMHKVTEVSPAAITLSFGTSGDVAETFKVTSATKVTLDSAPAKIEDLRAGMEARVKANADKTAEEIDAKGAVAHPAKHRVG